MLMVNYSSRSSNTIDTSRGTLAPAACPANLAVTGEVVLLHRSMME